MKIIPIFLVTFACISFAVAQDKSKNFDEIAPGLKIATNTISFAEGECLAYLTRWIEAYPDLNQKRIAEYSKADHDWVGRVDSRIQKILNEYVAKNPNQDYASVLKGMPTSDAEFYYAATVTLKTFDVKPPEYAQFALATQASCKAAKFPYFL